MVRYAQQEGITVSVADNLGDESGAKSIADRAVSISTADVEGLIEYSREHGVDAVLAGVSEFNLRNALSVSEALGTKFYCNSEQWDAFMDKAQFRGLCEKYGVPTPATYDDGSQRLGVDDCVSRSEVPCVVKPVDANSLRGITICTDKEELPQAVEHAIAESASGRVLVEEFVAGEEFTAAYVVVNGTASLTSIDIRIPFAFESMTTSFPILRVYPPPFASDYIDQCDSSVRQMLEGEALTNACVFVQGIYDGGRFAIFEAGLRLAGEATYRILEPVNGVSPLKHLVQSVCFGESTYDVDADDPFLGGETCAIVSYILRPGRVHSISNASEIAEAVPNVIESEQRYWAGDHVPDGSTLRQIGLRFVVRAMSVADIRATIADLNDRVEVLDSGLSSMVAKPDPEMGEFK